MKAGIYRHYKGGYYQFLGIAAHSETGEALAVYVSLDATRPGPRLRVRPLNGPAGFCSYVEPEGQPAQPRFMYVGSQLQPEALPNNLD